MQRSGKDQAKNAQFRAKALVCRSRDKEDWEVSFAFHFMRLGIFDPLGSPLRSIVHRGVRFHQLVDAPEFVARCVLHHVHDLAVQELVSPFQTRGSRTLVMDVEIAAAKAKTS
jgi:hypothetical protein